MGRFVTVDTGWRNAAVPGTGAAAFDVLEVKIGSGQFAFLHSARLMQSSEEGVTDIEEVQVALKKGVGHTSGSSTNGLTPNIIKGCTNDAAHGFATTKMFNTTQATAGGGTLETFLPGTFSIPTGEWEYTPIPELRTPILPSEAIIFSVDETTPFADSVTLRGILVFEVFG